MAPIRRSVIGGFSYIALLFSVAIAQMAVVGAMWVWSTAARREKEAQLLQIGNEVRTAIASYYERTPGPLKRYPPSLDALTRDQRQPVMTRYLRRVYPDPLTDTREWGIVKAPDGGVMGIYSTSGKQPLRTRFDGEDRDFSATLRYSDWKFVYLPPAAVTPKNVD